MIKLRRKRDVKDILRKYSIFLNGKSVGEVKYGEEIELDAPVGKNEIFVKIDWCRSQTISFEYDGTSTIEFECKNSMAGLKIFLGLLYISIWRDRYLWLERV